MKINYYKEKKKNFHWLKRFFLIIIFIGITIGIVSLYNHITNSPKFSIKKIIIKGNKNISKEEILKWSGIHVGKNLFKLKIKEAEKRIRMNTQIKKAKIKRRIPETLIIEIKEIEPIASLVSGTNFYQVDENGIIFPMSGSIKNLNVPIIEGINFKKENIAKKISDPNLDVALLIISAMSQIVKNRYKVDVSDLYNPEVTFTSEFLRDNSPLRGPSAAKASLPLRDNSAKASLGITNKNILIKFGNDNFSQKAKKLKVLLYELKKRRKNVSSIDLRYRGEAVVR